MQGIYAITTVLLLARTISINTEGNSSGFYIFLRNVMNYNLEVGVTTK